VSCHGQHKGCTRCGAMTSKKNLENPFSSVVKVSGTYTMSWSATPIIVSSSSFYQVGSGPIWYTTKEEMAEAQAWAEQKVAEKKVNINQDKIKAKLEKMSFPDNPYLSQPIEYPQELFPMSISEEELNKIKQHQAKHAEILDKVLEEAITLKAKAWLDDPCVPIKDSNEW
jgi:hypothetical protein